MGERSYGHTHIRGFPKVDHSGRSARIVLEQINSAKKNLPDYIRIIKVSVFQAIVSSTGVTHERQEMSSTDSPRVEGSTTVRGRFFF